jgi:predicted secreted protein
MEQNARAYRLEIRKKHPPDCTSLFQKVVSAARSQNMSAQTETLFITVLLVVSFFAAGCAPAGETTVTLNDDGKRIELSQGQALAVRLDANITTGYSWEITQATGPALQQQGEPQYQQDDAGQTPRVGAGGTQIFRFKAAAAGQTTLQLSYRRPWEKDVTPIKTFTLQVVVK